jgi:transcriptional regulator with XRE-family HTH domain
MSAIATREATHAPTAAAGAMIRGRPLDSIVLAGGVTWSVTTSTFDVPPVIDRTLANPTGKLATSPADVQVSAGAAIHTIRRLSGLTWDELADLFGVSRRSLHHWANGRPVSAAHDHTLRHVLAALRYIDRGDSARTRGALLAATPDGRLIVDLLKKGRYDEARAEAGAGSGEIHPPLAPLSPEAAAARRPPPLVAQLGALEDEPVIDRGRAVPSKAAWPPKRKGS